MHLQHVSGVDRPQIMLSIDQTWGQLHAKVINYNSITITF